MNTELSKSFSEEEIGNTLFHMGPLKASGLDGFPARFFQRNWKTIRGDIIKRVQFFLYRVDVGGDKRYDDSVNSKERGSIAIEGLQAHILVQCSV
jgi:hypothetical protein